MMRKDYIQPAIRAVEIGLQKGIADPGDGYLNVSGGDDLVKGEATFDTGTESSDNEMKSGGSLWDEQW